MPLLSIEINRPLEAPGVDTLLVEASKLLAGLLGKPEAYMMVRHQYNPDLRLGGRTEPAVLLELRSIGLPDAATQDLSRALCKLIAHHTDIPGNRVYILFEDVPRHLWGYDGTTF